MIKADVTYRAHLRKIKHHVPLFNRSFYLFCIYTIICNYINLFGILFITYIVIACCEYN